MLSANSSTPYWNQPGVVGLLLANSSIRVSASAIVYGVDHD